MQLNGHTDIADQREQHVDNANYSDMAAIYACIVNITNRDSVLRTQNNINQILG